MMKFLSVLFWCRVTIGVGKDQVTRSWCRCVKCKKMFRLEDILVFMKMMCVLAVICMLFDESSIIHILGKMGTIRGWREVTEGDQGRNKEK